MDINRLKYFMTVAETSNLRRAAELLRISPAALSKAMKVFEGEVGAKLLLPSGRGITVSEKGLALAARGKNVLEAVDALIHGARAATSEKPIVLGSFEVFTTYFAGPLLKEHLSDSSVIFRELIPGEMEEALISQEIDFAITYVPIPRAGVSHTKISQIEMGIYGARKFAESAFESLPFVVPVQPLKGTPTKVQGLDGWPEGKLNRAVRYKVTMMETALELCRKGLAVAYLPTFIARMHNEQVKEKFQLHALAKPKGLGPGKHPVYLVTRKNDEESLVHRKIAKAIRLLCK